MASLLDYLGYAGNLLDLPGSSARDILSGRNPVRSVGYPLLGREQGDRARRAGTLPRQERRDRDGRLAL
jgi:hypothetical protein